MREIEWRLIIPLIVLYVIGILGFWSPIYVPTIAALAKNGVNQEWLGFIGNVLAGCFTLIAAAAAWFAVRRQIRSQELASEKLRKQKEFAARAVLPLSLSALQKYISDCIYALEGLPDPVSRGTVFRAPALPLNDINEIKNALESMSSAPAVQLASTLQFLQIQHARLIGIEKSAWDGMLLTYDRQRRMIDALDLNALIDRSYNYARGANYEAPTSSWTELRTAFDINRLSDLDYPLILKEIEHRQNIRKDR